MAEFLFELIFTLYVELMGLIIPEEKQVSKAFRMMIAVFAVIMIFGLMAMALFGIYLVAGGRNPVLGWGLIVGSILLSISQIAVGIILKSRKEEN